MHTYKTFFLCGPKVKTYLLLLLLCPTKNGVCYKIFWSNITFTSCQQLMPWSKSDHGITSHEQKDTGFVMKRVHSSHIATMTCNELSLIVCWLAAARSLADVNTKGSKLSQQKNCTILLPLRKRYVAQSWWITHIGGLHHQINSKSDKAIVSSKFVWFLQKRAGNTLVRLCSQNMIVLLTDWGLHLKSLITSSCG
jgi:hypothetical protein